MKKSLGFLLVLLIVSALAMPAFAAGEQPVPDAVELAMADEELIDEQHRLDGESAMINEPRLADGQPGRGSVSDPEEYWAQNGYPDHVSFAYEAGGELLGDGTVISWWEIGVVNTDEGGRQAILDLLSTNCRVTFRECGFSHAQREAAYNEVLAKSVDDGNIHGAVMGRNSEAIVVEVADGYEKEYAREFIQQYGSFVLVTNELPSEDSLGAIVSGGWDAGGNSPGLAGDGIETGTTPVAAMGGIGNSWFWPLCLLALLGLAAVLFMNRTRLVPTLQTTQGTVATQSAPVGKKETILAVKNSEAAPDDKVFDSICQRIGE